MVPSTRTGSGYGDPVEGNFTFVDAPPDWNDPWKLCFRFGYGGPFLAYPQYRMRVKRIDNVTILSHDVAFGEIVKTGDHVTLSFSGLGIAHTPLENGPRIACQEAVQKATQ